MYHIFVTPTFEKDIAKIDISVADRIIKKSAESSSEDPQKITETTSGRLAHSFLGG